MGFENDKLGRKYYADILTEIIENPEKYKRNSDSESFTIAIDSSWGTGKTEFLKMWEDELNSKKDENGKDEYIVIPYNSWENDFSKNPLQSIIYTILTNKAFDIENNKEKGKEILEKGSKKLLKNAFETIIKASKQNYIPEVQIIGSVVEKGVKLGKEVIKTMLQETCMEEQIKEFKSYNNSLKDIRAILEKVTEKTKIILLIDELDRCKPLFAIKLLETIKHIFNVKNMSFVFALDMTQLSYSVKKVYGNEIDATGYICRFFDYITKMPKPDTRKYIEYLMEKRPLIRKNPYFKEEVFYRPYGERERNSFLDMLHEYVQMYQLSLRDINTIYSNFVILEERELKDIDNRKAYALYLFLLILKYKDLELFNEIFIMHNFVPNDVRFLNKIKQSAYFSADTIVVIKDNTKIENIKFLTPKGNEKILSVDIQTKEYKYSRGISEYKEKYNVKTELASCLFYSDIENYDNIKEMGIADYIHQKLELFDFEWMKKETGQE